MARLGQLNDTLYRFWGDESFYNEIIRITDEMIILQENCIDLVPQMISESHHDEHEELIALYHFYSKKSLRIMRNLRQSILDEDDESAQKWLEELDLNRRKAHSHFG